MKPLSKIKPDIMEALEVCAHLLKESRDPWYIIGGTARYLYELNNNPIKDVDIVCSTFDAKRISQLHSCPNLANQDSPKFKSEILIKLKSDRIPIEIMAGLQAFSNGQWRPIIPRKTRQFNCSDFTIFIPTREGFIRILDEMGRENDRAYANILRNSKPL